MHIYAHMCLVGITKFAQECSFKVTGATYCFPGRPLRRQWFGQMSLYKFLRLTLAVSPWIRFFRKRFQRQSLLMMSVILQQKFWSTAPPRLPLIPIFPCTWTIIPITPFSSPEIHNFDNYLQEVALIVNSCTTHFYWLGRSTVQNACSGLLRDTELYLV